MKILCLFKSISRDREATVEKGVRLSERGNFESEGNQGGLHENDIGPGSISE